MCYFSFCSSAAGLGCHILAQLRMTVSRGQSVPILLQTSTAKPCVALGLRGSWLELSWLHRWAVLLFLKQAAWCVCSRAFSSKGEGHGRQQQGAGRLVPVIPGSFVCMWSSGWGVCVCVFLNLSARFRACCCCSSWARGLLGFLLRGPHAQAHALLQGKGLLQSWVLWVQVWCSVLTCAAMGLTTELASAGGVENGSSQAQLVCVWT